MAPLPAAQRADAEGALVRADRRARRGRDDVAAGVARRRAQLGLPLHVDPRLDVHALGPLHASASTGRRTTSSTSSPTSPRRERRPADHVRRSTARPSCRSARSTTSRATRARGRCASATAPTDQDQHDVWGALLDSFYLHTKSRDQLPERIWPILVSAGRDGARALARARPRDLGDARRAEALHLVQGHVLGRRRPRRPPGGDPRRAWSTRRAGSPPPTRSRRTSARTRVDERGVFCQHYDTTALDASVLLMPLVRFLPADDPRIRSTVLAIADELTEDGLVLRYRRRGDRRRPRRRGGHVHDLLVLARLGARGDRRARSGRATCARSCCPTRARSACTRRRSTRRAAATSATSRRRSRTSR